MEETIEFKNKKGESLFGIMHVPDDASFNAKKIGINLLNPGIKSRVAPNRLNVKIARRLCKEGFYVLRFDPSGIGDSAGEISSGKKVEVWGKIQRGLFVDDTKTSNDFFVNNYGIKDLILIGNCGGAITAILTAAIDKRVGNLVLIDVPVILIGPDYSFADGIIKNTELVDKFFGLYLKKIF
ncbi:MAG: alpha/beta hydrolase, partial [Thermotogota bacterium]|nr:alpha/beta hydrolase [Thermotogota bacterium]